MTMTTKTTTTMNVVIIIVVMIIVNFYESNFFKIKSQNLDQVMAILKVVTVIAAHQFTHYGLSTRFPVCISNCMNSSSV